MCATHDSRIQPYQSTHTHLTDHFFFFREEREISGSRLLALTVSLHVRGYGLRACWECFFPRSRSEVEGERERCPNPQCMRKVQVCCPTTRVEYTVRTRILKRVVHEQADHSLTPSLWYAKVPECALLTRPQTTDTRRQHRL